MTWPTLTDVVSIKNESRRRAYREKREAMEAEVAELRARKAARDKEQSANSALDAVVEMLRSEEFDEWYQALTGEGSKAWVDSVLNVSPKMLRPLGKSMVDWIELSYKSMVHKHRMRDPSHRLLMAKEVRECKDPYRRRRLQQRLATPKWADPAEIAKVYRRRDRTIRETGIAHEVDHIVPIQHPLVCGLHVEHNLRVITKTRNLKKKNAFFIE